jgi:hypothetical protein
MQSMNLVMDHYMINVPTLHNHINPTISIPSNIIKISFKSGCLIAYIPPLNSLYMYNDSGHHFVQIFFQNFLKNLGVP